MSHESDLTGRQIEKGLDKRRKKLEKHEATAEDRVSQWSKKNKNRKSWRRKKTKLQNKLTEYKNYRNTKIKKLKPFITNRELGRQGLRRSGGRLGTSIIGRAAMMTGRVGTIRSSRIASQVQQPASISPRTTNQLAASVNAMVGNPGPMRAGSDPLSVQQSRIHTGVKTNET